MLISVCGPDLNIKSWAKRNEGDASMERHVFCGDEWCLNPFFSISIITLLDMKGLK